MKIDYKDDGIIKEIYNCAMEVFSHGIAVPSEAHPCGWDWLDFDMVDDILTHQFHGYDISGSAYEQHDYDWMTLKEILEENEGRFLFEINTNIDWESR